MASKYRENTNSQYSEGDDADPEVFGQDLPWLIPFSSDDEQLSDDSGYKPDDDSDDELVVPEEEQENFY